MPLTRFDYNRAWDYLNEACFNDEMVRPKIHCFQGALWAGQSDRLLVGAYHCGSHEMLFHVGSYANHHEGGPLETLYHEMVHQYIDEVLDASNENPDHGTLFKEIYESGLIKLNKRKDVMAKSDPVDKDDKGGAAEAKLVSGGSKKTHGAGQGGVGPPGISGTGQKETTGPKQTR